MTASPLSLYIHIPWCLRRCGYCDFNTYVLGDLEWATGIWPYLQAIRDEIQRASSQGDFQVTTIFFGGGTPTVLETFDFEYILEAISEFFNVAPDAEITTEANPETLTLQGLKELRALGINRLSLGVQSFVPHVLNTLDRSHTPGHVRQIVTKARKAGFENLSVDLIYGTPGESMKDWETTLNQTLDLNPDHISAYSLIVEGNTPLARRIAAGELPPTDEDDLADKYIRADEAFTQAGLPWYEVSNWAKPGHQCRHNLAYWHSQPWWGIGVGAHSYINKTRWWNLKYPPTYVEAWKTGESTIKGREDLSEEQIRMESIMLGIRLVEGFDKGLLTETELARVQSFLDSGYLIEQDTHLIPTLTGRLTADRILRDILD
ncbi:MAG: radical SAM family heme chaperone HemW [Propionibacteriaceae bacterium]|nr:radical SAM family heme chaperone HemW [Propionibacteriaceae bacterium]